MPLNRALPCLALAFLAACASPSLPDENYTERGGEKLVALFARYDHANNATNSDFESLVIDADLGYFLGDHHELGLSLDGLWSRNESAESTNTFIGPFYNYIFKLSPRASLYIGPDILFQSFDSDQQGVDSVTEVGYGGHIGARFWYSPHVSFVIEPSYLFTDYDDDVGGEQDLTRVKFGVAVKF